MAFNPLEHPPRKKIRAGVLGATGAVGQRFVQLLQAHPWFELAALAASEQSAGKTYEQACRWILPGSMPQAAGAMPVLPIEPGLDCEIVFSALPSDVAGPTEEAFARAGYAVCSNAAAHRMDADAPLLIPEVNAGHTALIEAQRNRRGWSGLLVTNPNCSSTQLALALKPLDEAFGVRRMMVTTMQAISGAGYPGLAALDILENVIPYIGGEEDKLDTEPQKLLGRYEVGAIHMADFRSSAQCNRVAVREGHMECVSVEFEQRPTPEQAARVMGEYRGEQQAHDLPSTPERPLLLHTQKDRPQPRRDSEAQGGMVVHIGRLRPCPLFDLKFVVLGHNTLRGAAGGAIHNAELLVAQGWVGS
jgi:aspartate-semialdehyde dehydrogenase